MSSILIPKGTYIQIDLLITFSRYYTRVKYNPESNTLLFTNLLHHSISYIFNIISMVPVRKFGIL